MEKPELENIRNKVLVGLKTAKELYGDNAVQDILEVITMSYSDLAIQHSVEEVIHNQSNQPVLNKENNRLIHDHNKNIKEECINFLINELNYYKNEIKVQNINNSKTNP